jgi:hypothetical protein
MLWRKGRSREHCGRIVIGDSSLRTRSSLSVALAASGSGRQQVADACQAVAPASVACLAYTVTEPGRLVRCGNRQVRQRFEDGRSAWRKANVLAVTIPTACPPGHPGITDSFSADYETSFW